MSGLPYTDFHSHFLSPNAVYCTAQPMSLTPQESLLYCQGLLPQFWTKEKQEELLTNLKTSKLHLGEVGLDKRYQQVLDLKEQEENLLTMLQYAKTADKIVTIHSVQATELTINLLKLVNLKPWKTIWHGFTGSKETAQILFKMGIFVSIGLRYRGNLKELSNVHPNFVLESDYEGYDQTQYNCILQAHYQKCAEQLEWTTEKLKEHCFGQAQTLTN